MDRPFVWQMIKQAVESLNGRASYGEIKQYINSKWNNVNESTINAQITVLTVNQPSRIHYPENRRPKISNSQYDVLFSTGRGQVVKYNQEEHGLWEIYENEFGARLIRQVMNQETSAEEDVPEEAESSFLFPIEANLRDFLIWNLHTVKDVKLKLYVDANGRDGKEYPTDVGPIDILAQDEKETFSCLS